MTTTSVADAKPTATVLQEYPSLFRTWWTNKNLQYDFVMGFILIILNVAAILYMVHHKIPFTVNKSPYFSLCIIGYVVSGLASCMAWSWAIALVEAYDMYILGRICHIFGFAILVRLLYFISPRLALWFGIPCSLWFLAAFIEPLYKFWLAQVFQDFRDCWKLVNKPQFRVVTV